MTLAPWFLAKRPLRFWSKHRAWDIAAACAVLVGAAVIFVQSVKAQDLNPLAPQVAYTTADPNDPERLGLATLSGRYSIQLSDRCSGVGLGQNVVIYPYLDIPPWLAGVADGA